MTPTEPPQPPATPPPATPPPAMPPPPPAMPPPPGPPGYPGYAAMQPPNNQKALWALILGIPSVLCCGAFTGIPALILGIIGRREVQESNGTQRGQGLALAGIILGAIGIVLSIFGILIYSMLAAAAVRRGIYRPY